MVTSELLAALRAHYIAPGRQAGGVFLPEVSFNGGYGSGNRCDAVWVDFTTAGGHLMVGHELKVSRSDWLQELANPTKSEAWASQCHRWWIVAQQGVVTVGEVPAGAGLMCPAPGRRRFKTVVDAPFHDVQPSWDVCRSVIARSNTLEREIRREMIVDAVEKRLGEVRENERRNARAEFQRQLEKAEAAQQFVNDLSEAIGYAIFSESRGFFMAGPLGTRSLKAEAIIRAAKQARTDDCLAGLVQDLCTVKSYVESFSRQVETLQSLLTGLEEGMGRTKGREDHDEKRPERPDTQQGEENGLGD